MHWVREIATRFRIKALFSSQEINTEIKFSAAWQYVLQDADDYRLIKVHSPSIHIFSIDVSNETQTFDPYTVSVPCWDVATFPFTAPNICCFFLIKNWSLNLTFISAFNILYNIKNICFHSLRAHEKTVCIYSSDLIVRNDGPDIVT